MNPDPAQTPVVSIIIPVFNNVEYTRKCIEAINHNTPPDLYELIIIDNASTDGTNEFLNSLGNRAEVITNSANLGYTIANNQGAVIANGKYLGFLNNDTLPLKGWLENLIDTAERDPSVGAVGAKMLYPDGKLQEAGALIFSDGTAFNFGKGDNPDKDIYNEFIEVDYCSGACLLVRYDLFTKLGGFDVRYAPAYFEDSDLCFGIRKLGFKVIYNPKASVIHHESATAGEEAIKLYEINRIKFVQKWKTELLLQEPSPHLSSIMPTTAKRERLKKKSPKVTTKIISGSLSSADNLGKLAFHWEILAKNDPLWAILSAPEKKGNKWDIDEFLVTGKHEIDGLIDYLHKAYNFKNWQSALDFGCGIGRLTLFLANYFDTVVGIDISDTMISLAENLAKQYGSNIKGEIQYILNKSNTIPFDNERFDLVYSNIVLQHMHKDNALFYISEFIRVLKKDGFAVFQAPSRCLTTPGEKFESPIDTPGGTAIVEMNLIPINAAIDTVYQAGGKIIEIRKDYSATEVFESFKYYISK